MYSDMSIRIISFSSSNKNSASARASSVLPTPVCPRNMNEPCGRVVSETYFRDLCKLAGALAALRLRVQLLNLFLQFADFADGLLFRLPTRLAPARLLA